MAATTRRSLAELRGSAHFDAGLLCRFAVAPLVMPPLRDRRSDIPMLAKALLRRAARRHGVKEPMLAAETETLLEALELRGNVTELDTIVTAALIAVASSGDGTGLIGRACIELASDDVERKEQGPAGSLLRQNLDEDRFTLEGHNQRIYDEALERCKGNVAAASRLLGLSRAQLAYRLRLRRSKSTAPT